MHFYERKRIETIEIHGGHYINGAVRKYALMYSEDEVLWRYLRTPDDKTIYVSAATWSWNLLPSTYPNLILSSSKLHTLI